MEKIVDYYIAVSGEIQELEDLVKEKLSEGWQPLGGAFQGGKDMSYLNQTLVKIQE